MLKVIHIEPGLRELDNTLDDNGDVIGSWADEMNDIDGEPGHIVGYTTSERAIKSQNRALAKEVGYGTGYARQMGGCDEMDESTARLHVEAAVSEATKHLHHHSLMAAGQESPLNNGGYVRGSTWAQENSVRGQSFRLAPEPPMCASCGLYLDEAADDNPDVGTIRRASFDTSDYGSATSLSGAARCTMTRANDTTDTVANINVECLSSHDTRVTNWVTRNMGKIDTTVTPAAATDLARSLQGKCQLGRIKLRPMGAGARRFARSVRKDQKGLGNRVGRELIGGVRAGDTCERLQNNLMANDLITVRESRKMVRGQQRLIQVE